MAKIKSLEELKKIKEQAKNTVSLRVKGENIENMIQIRVAMEKGIFHIEDNTLFKIEADSSRTVICKAPKLEGIKFYYGASHSRMIERFRLAVENNTDDYIHVKDGTTVIRLMDSIFRSANTGALVEV